MNILFVTPSYKPAFIYGGPAISVSELAESLVAIGHRVTVYTTTANGKEELNVVTGRPMNVHGVTVYYFKRQSGDHTHVSIGLWRRLWSTVSHFEVIHLQSWWSLLILGAAAICLLKRCAYVLSPRGMLSHYSFKHQHSSSKKLIHRTIGLPLLRRSHLHATTALEWRDCLQVNPSWKGFVLSNIIRFPQTVVQKKKSHVPSVLTFGFMSRVDPKKGLELLLHALAQCSFAYRLKVAGSGEADYLASLKTLAVQLGISHNLEWCGWKAGEEKYRFLQSIDVFVLTSYNENFANAVIESLAVGTPVFLSEGVGLADYVRTNQIGWVCETTVRSLTAGLHQVFSEREHLSVIQASAPLLVQRDFDKLRLARQYAEVYERFVTPSVPALIEDQL